MSEKTGAWYADPTRRHSKRYFDGREWTEHVADEEGRQATDPLTSEAAPAAPGEAGGTTSTTRAKPARVMPTRPGSTAGTRPGAPPAPVDRPIERDHGALLPDQRPSDADDDFAGPENEVVADDDRPFRRDRPGPEVPPRPAPMGIGRGYEGDAGRARAERESIDPVEAHEFAPSNDGRRIDRDRDGIDDRAEGRDQDLRQLHERDRLDDHRVRGRDRELDLDRDDRTDDGEQERVWGAIATPGPALVDEPEPEVVEVRRRRPMFGVGLGLLLTLLAAGALAASFFALDWAEVPAPRGDLELRFEDLALNSNYEQLTDWYDDAGYLVGLVVVGLCVLASLIRRISVRLVLAVAAAGMLAWHLMATIDLQEVLDGVDGQADIGAWVGLAGYGLAVLGVLWGPGRRRRRQQAVVDGEAEIDDDSRGWRRRRSRRTEATA